MPTVSVIMSEYKTEDAILKESIDSILEQDFRDFELIIVNDGNSAYLRQLVKNYQDNRIILIENKKNIGLAKSLNKAIKKSKGKYLVRMDTDDVAHKNRIKVQLDYINKHPEYSVVGTSINLQQNGKKYPKIFKGEIDKNKLMNRIAPVHPSVIMKKKDIIEVGMYETDRTTRSEDFVLWSKLLLSRKRIYNMADILLDYRVDDEDYNKRTLNSRKDEIYNRIIYYKKMGASFTQYLSIFKSIIAAIVPKKIIKLYHRQNT